MKKKTIAKKAAKKNAPLKEVKPIGWDGDACEYCGKRTDTLMQVSGGGYACECCLDEAEKEVEAERERERELNRESDPSFFRSWW